MNENLQQALSEVLTSALNTVGQAKEFVLAELPDVVQQLLRWKMAESLVDCAVGLLFLLIPCILWYLSRGEEWADRDDNLTKRGGFAIAAGMSSVIGLLVAPAWLNLVWLQIWLAPKVYLIEYAASLVKQAA